MAADAKDDLAVWRLDTELPLDNAPTAELLNGQPPVDVNVDLGALEAEMRVAP